MSDNLTRLDRKRTMQAVKSTGTRPERRLFATLSALGIGGWKKNPSGIPGNPDAAFAARKAAIFVDGCFWHGCPHCHKPMPRTNRAYWKRKIARNVSLAKSYNRRLRRNGWTVIRIWAHELVRPGQLAARLKELPHD